MEIFELKYFLGVARTENMHQASLDLHISPGSLSKAIAKLEAELGVNLFERVGRNIRLTDHGQLLKKRATEIIELEESTRTQLTGSPVAQRVLIAGSELALARFGTDIARRLGAKFKGLQFEFRNSFDDPGIVQKVVDRDVHLGLLSGATKTVFSPAMASQLEARLLQEVVFRTCVGARHPLAARARQGAPVDIDELLGHAFVSPDKGVLGQLGLKESVDGWRDDKFPRQISFAGASLKIMETLLAEGQAVAYLPDYYVEQQGLVPLSVVGCAYTCAQRITLVARRPQDSMILRELFD